MPTHGAGAIGSLDYPPEERKKLANRYLHVHVLTVKQYCKNISTRNVMEKYCKSSYLLWWLSTHFYIQTIIMGIEYVDA